MKFNELKKSMDKATREELQSKLDIAQEKVCAHGWYTGDSVAELTELKANADKAITDVQTIIDTAYISALGADKLMGFIKDPYRPVFAPKATISKKGERNYDGRLSDEDSDKVSAIYSLLDIIITLPQDKQDKFAIALNNARKAIVAYGLLWATRPAEIEDMKAHLEKSFAITLEDDEKGIGANKAEKSLQELCDCFSNGKGFKATIFIARQMIVTGGVLKMRKNGQKKLSSMVQFTETIGHFLHDEYVASHKSSK